MPIVDDIRIDKSGKSVAPKKLLYAHILLDRSGSMESDRDATIGALNEYINGLAVDTEVDSRISLTIFDSHSIDLIRDNIPAKECEKLNRETYVPRGGTPLNDAIGQTVARIDGEKRRDTENTAFIILTDGQENSSREYTKDAIKKLLEGRQKDKNWLVIFLGADIDVFHEGGGRGTQAGHTMAFNKASVGATMQAAHRVSKSYAMSGQSMDALFSDAERAASIGATGPIGVAGCPTGSTGGLPIPPISPEQNKKVQDALDKSKKTT